MDENIKGNLKRSFEIQKQSFEKNKANYIKKDVKIALRRIIKKNTAESDLKNKIIQQWFTCFFLFQMAGSLNEMYDVKMRAHKRKIRVLTHVLQFSNKTQNKVEARGEDFEERLILDMRM